MHHFESGSTTLLKRIGRFFEYVGSQLGILTPVLCVLIYAVIGAALKVWKRLGDRERYLWLFSAPALLVMLLMGLRQRINPNWPAVFYIAATVLVVAWAANKWSLNLKIDGWRRAFNPGLKLGIGLAVTVYVLVTVFSIGVIKLNGVDPSARIRGWSTIARDVQSARNELPDGLMLITQSHRFLTSEMAFYLPDQPRVYVYNSNPTLIETQHDLWENPSSHLGEDALIIVQGEAKEVDPGLAERFESTELLQINRYPQLRKNQNVITLFLGKNLKRWPTFDNP
jgi:hypothetical protein